MERPAADDDSDESDEEGDDDGGPLAHLRHMREADETQRALIFDAAGELEVHLPNAHKAPAGPTLLQLPLIPMQAMITVRASHASALVAIDSLMTVIDMHMQPRDLSVFSDFAFVRAMLNELLERHRPQGEPLGPDWTDGVM